MAFNLGLGVPPSVVFSDHGDIERQALGDQTPDARRTGAAVDQLVTRTLCRRQEGSVSAIGLTCTKPPTTR